MGAYVHLIEGLPDTFTDIESSNNSMQMDEHSSFWAGRWNDCFADFAARKNDTPAIRKGYSTREGRMGRTEGENSGQSSRNTCRAVLDRGGGSSLSRFDVSRGKAAENILIARGEGCSESGYYGTEVSMVRDAEMANSSFDLEEDISVESEDEELEDFTEGLPEHLLIEILVRLPTRDWPAAGCVKKRWGQLYRSDVFWHYALMRQWPEAGLTKRWPGPISRGSSRRRFIALHVSNSVFVREKLDGIDEVAGHVYLFLKEQLESSTPPASYSLLHGTIIDQFLACSKTGDEAHELASLIWVAVLDNLDETENTFRLLMRIAEEWEVFLPYPYTKSHAVQWRLFERLFTDFRDCLSQYNYFDVLARAKHRFDIIPATWLGKDSDLSPGMSWEQNSF
ncbi:hypothetical protein R1flu_028101 [Riccia fluitans]|uniref:F-box domain-containing protein n=1 Tax=Riccia fluitans TaxID=41844 RepID=A0ABD1XLD7_9MARC